MAKSDYLGNFNEFMSLLAIGCLKETSNSRLSCLASPTLSKQESLTSLYHQIQSCKSSGAVELKSLIALLLFLPRLLSRVGLVCILKLVFKSQKIPNQPIVFRSWLAPASFSAEKFDDAYFGQILALVQDRKDCIHVISGINPRLNLQLKFLGLHPNTIHSVSLISWRDIYKIFFEYFTDGPVRTEKSHYFCGRDVTRFIKTSLFFDYFDLRSLPGYIEAAVAKNLAKKNPKKFIYIYENQAWEKCVIDQFKHSGTEIIGYQSSGFSDFFLNFFPSKFDLEWQPMPSKVLTVGDHFTRRLKELGCYKIPVETYCGLRFRYKSVDGKFRVLEPNPTIIGSVMYAFPVHLNQYTQIMSTLTRCFGLSPISVYLKVHPLYKDRAKDLFKRLPENFYILDDINSEDMRDRFDVVLFNDNSFGIEAILMGVKSFQLSLHMDQGLSKTSYQIPSDERLIYFDLWEPWLDEQSLRQLEEEIISNKFDKSFDLFGAEEYLSKMFKPFSNQKINELIGPLSKCKSMY